MSQFDFSDILNQLTPSDLAEKPVDIDTFISHPDYLNDPYTKLSSYQREAVLASTQIYRKETLLEFLSPEEAQKRWDQTMTEVILQFGKGCHAPETPIFNANTGAWQRLDSIKEDTLVMGMNDDMTMQAQYATEAFIEGHGEMVEIETQLGLKETVYIGHQYYGMPWAKYERINNWARWIPAAELAVGDLIAVGLNYDVENPVDMPSGEISKLLRELDLTDELAELPPEFWKSSNKAILPHLLVLFGGEDLTTNSYELAHGLQRAMARCGRPYRMIRKNKRTWILRYRPTKVRDGLCWDKIIRIRKKGKGDYWTLTQPETHNYVGNMLISHQSGKDMLSTFSCAYLIYLLLCLKDPAAYYNKPPGDSFDILNIAVNSDQAKNVFFKGVVRLLKQSNYFKGKYDAKDDRGEPSQASEVHFDHNINLFSGHSEREAWEGYNVIMVVLDEISGFATESSSESKKTADAIYDMYRASVDSRFPEFGKVVLLSFPRYKGDFITTHYNSVIARKETIKRKEIVKVNPDLPDDLEGNYIAIEWDEDHILDYHLKGVYAIRRPTWDVNPTKKITDYVNAFYRNKPDATGRFACQPAEAIDAFFKDVSKIDKAMIARNGVDKEGRFEYFLRPQSDKDYYVHVDLARKHDNCAVALAHVEKWQQARIGPGLTEAAPVVYVDAIRFWQPTKEKSVDFAEVREYIVSLQKRGFNIKVVTFDQWESDDMRKYLEALGMKTDKLSVAKKHYQDLAMAIGEERVILPDIDVLRTELLQLRITNDDKVDHPRSGTKDLADASCGAIFNCIQKASRPESNEVDIKTYSNTRERPNQIVESARGKVIKAPEGTVVPTDLADFMARVNMI